MTRSSRLGVIYLIGSPPLPPLNLQMGDLREAWEMLRRATHIDDSPDVKERADVLQEQLQSTQDKVGAARTHTQRAPSPE